MYPVIARGDFKGPLLTDQKPVIGSSPSGCCRDEKYYCCPDPESVAIKQVRLPYYGLIEKDQRIVLARTTSLLLGM